MTALSATTPPAVRLEKTNRALLLAAAALAFSTGCREKPTALRLVEIPEPTVSQQEPTSPEQFPASETAFGLPVPQGMRITDYFPDAAYMAGHIALHNAVEHVRDNVLASVAEVTPGKTVFPLVYIRGDADKRLCRIEVSKIDDRRSRIWIRDVTPPPSPRGLSETERWKRAGRNSDGTLLDPNSVF